MRARENLLNNVRAFETDGELLARACVISARVERSVGLHHRGRGEVEITVARWSMNCQVMYQRSAFTDNIPMNSVVSGNDAIRLNIGECCQSFLEQTHDARIVRIAHHRRPDTGNEPFL